MVVNKKIRACYLALYRGLDWLKERYAPLTTKGAKYAKQYDYETYLSWDNRGLLLDGHKYRLTEKESFEHVLQIAPTGVGKTTTYVFPNLMELSFQENSIIVNDPSWEMFAITSAWMQKQGFEVKRFHPEEPNQSDSFNPLSEAISYTEIEKMAVLLVLAGLEEDDFWAKWATQFVSFFMHCLKQESSQQANSLSPSRIFKLLQAFGEDGSSLDKYVAKYGTKELIYEWCRLTNLHKDGLQSILMTAATALKIFSNPDIAEVTSRSDFSVSDIRKKKTIVYLNIPSQDLDYYKPLVSLFFQALFNGFMRQLPKDDDLSVFIILDEFWHTRIPSFHETINTIRKYRVSITGIVQEVSQIHDNYGKRAKTVLWWFSTLISYGGIDADTSEFIEKKIGRVRWLWKYRPVDQVDNYREFNLINAGELRILGADQQLVVSKNRHPVVLKRLPYYRNPRYLNMLLGHTERVTAMNQPAQNITVAIELPERYQSLMRLHIEVMIWATQQRINNRVSEVLSL